MYALAPRPLAILRGVALAVAAIASLSLGVVLGPEAPLIALGGGCTLLMVSQLKKDVPQQALFLMNSPFTNDQSRKLIERAGFKSANDNRARIEFLYQTFHSLRVEFQNGLTW